MDRRKELDEIFKGIDVNIKKLVDPLIEDVVFLEDQMDELKKLPFISTHPTKPTLQKKTEAAKLYKECSQSYMNAIRILCSLLHKDDGNDDSPLREYLKGLKRKYEDD